MVIYFLLGYVEFILELTIASRVAFHVAARIANHGKLVPFETISQLFTSVNRTV